MSLPRRSAGRLLAIVATVVAATSAATGASPAGAATVLAEIGPFAAYAVGHVPGGGYLVVWRDASSERLQVQRVSPGGFPVGSFRTVFEPLDGDFLFASVGSVAVSATGDWAVLWTQPHGADQIGIGGAFFDAQDRLLGHVVWPDPIPDPHQVVTTGSPRAVALPGGGYAVAFTLGDVDPPSGDPLRPTETRAFLMRVDASGNRLGEAVQVSEGPEEFQSAAGVGFGGGHLVALTGAVTADIATTAVRVRLFGLDMAPLSPELPVADAAAPKRVHSAELGVGPDGRFLVVWAEDGPDGDHAPGAQVLLRPFSAAGHSAGPPVEPAGQGSPVTGAPDLAVTEQGIAWVSWLEPQEPSDPPVNRMGARPFDLAAAPLAAPFIVDTVLGGAHQVTGGVAGALVTWHPGPTVVGTVVGLAAGAGPPPPELALTSPEVPGFRVWARFTTASGVTRWGTAVEPCLAEALCVAGALADRAELIVRVVGPRPNGFLWPILAPLTVSRVEVWIQQLDGGAVRYYVLPGSEPPSELLPGRFDRDGFLP